MRKLQFVLGNYYHICNRSNDRQEIFIDEGDYKRMLFSILLLQLPTTFYNVYREIADLSLVQHRVLNIARRMVELNAFIVVPNHFHLLIQEKTEKGVSRYLQRLQNSYTKYFNTKYGKSGHLFQGPFRAVHVTTDEQLLYLSAYMHRNPRELEEWKDKEDGYPWSSYQDCIGSNRWGELLKPDTFLSQFSSIASYRSFVETSTAKLKLGESPVEDLLLE